MKSFLCFLTLTLLAIETTVAQTITEIHYPRFVQGVGSSNASDDRKVPFACRMKIDGLTPGATYRYYPRFVADPSQATNGQGYYIIVKDTGNYIRVTSASLSTAGRYGEFTTDGSGSYTGWFIIEPSLALEFQPGTPLYFRLMLNNGAGGGSVATRVTASNSVTVLGWGSNSNQGTGLRVIPDPGYIPKNFVMLYDNEQGTGRPVSGTFVESDGTDNNSTTSGYAPFYGNSVDGVNNTWGTIIPNNLVTGIRRISQFDKISGDAISGLTNTNGIFSTLPSGTISTANASSGLNELVIAAAPLPVELIYFKGSMKDNSLALLQWKSGEEINFEKFVIEKSSSGRDFREIGTVLAKGSHSEYSFSNVQPEMTAYYRLKIVDIDNHTDLSDIIRLTKKENYKLEVFPNPALNELNLKINGTTDIWDLSVMSASGVVVDRKKITAGPNAQKINISSLQAGSYFLILRSGEEIRTGSFQKL